VTGPDILEVAPVERDDDVSAEALGEGHNRSVGAAEWKIGVQLDKLANAGPVGTERRRNVKVTKTAQERCFDH
jgi:hypothetical protein